MTCQSVRFGTLEFEQEDLLTFAEGLLGFPQYLRYLIVCNDAGSPFRWMQAVDEPGLAFLVADPENIVPGYAPALPIVAAEKLGLTEETPRLVYVIVSIPPGMPQEMTANLAGPIVINAESSVAAQVVVEEPEWSPRHRVAPDPPAEQTAA